ncbi:MAG: hypothetical protein GY856_35415, partial [bacterium]|nr:hypothetical protein [bacterium]
FVAPAGEAVIFRTIEGIVVEVPAAAFDKATLVTVTHLPVSSLGLPTPAGMGLGAYVDVDFEGEARETLRLHLPAPAEVDDDAQVFFGAPVHLPWGKRLQLISVGGLIERDGERFLSNDPTVQPEPTSTKDRKAGPAKTCADVLREGLPLCYIMSQVAEFRMRHSAAVFYEKGATAALISGAAAPVTSTWGRTM